MFIVVAEVAILETNFEPVLSRSIVLLMTAYAGNGYVCARKRVVALPVFCDIISRRNEPVFGVTLFTSIFVWFEIELTSVNIIMTFHTSLEPELSNHAA